MARSVSRYPDQDSPFASRLDAAIQHQRGQVGSLRFRSGIGLSGLYAEILHTTLSSEALEMSGARVPRTTRSKAEVAPFASVATVPRLPSVLTRRERRRNSSVLANEGDSPVRSVSIAPDQVCSSKSIATECPAMTPHESVKPEMPPPPFIPLFDPAGNESPSLPVDPDPPEGFSTDDKIPSLGSRPDWWLQD